MGSSTFSSLGVPGARVARSGSRGRGGEAGTLFQEESVRGAQERRKSKPGTSKGAQGLSSPSLLRTEDRSELRGVQLLGLGHTARWGLEL